MLCIFFTSSWAQGEIQDDLRKFHGDELTFSAGIQTSGFGIGTRYAKRKTALKKSFYEFQASSIHHQKEIKTKATSGGKFTYGKLNYIYSFQFSFGTQNEKYSKLDKGSVAIRFIKQAGISLVLEKPYYYITYIDGKEEYVLFDASSSKNGKAPYFYGTKESKFVPGIFAASALNFEFSNQDKIIRALEFGVLIQAYPQKLQIMYTKENNWILSSLFITYRFGSYLD